MELSITNKLSDRKEALDIAKSLPEYFTKEAVENMKKDFREDSLIIAKGSKIYGFLCFGLRKGKYEILWIAVIKEKQSKGIGKEMLYFLIDYLKQKKIKELHVKTLSHEDPYEPYKRTRKFYESNGFEKLYIEKAKKPGWDDQVVMRFFIK